MERGRSGSKAGPSRSSPKTDSRELARISDMAVAVVHLDRGCSRGWVPQAEGIRSFGEEVCRGRRGAVAFEVPGSLLVVVGSRRVVDIDLVLVGDRGLCTKVCQ